MKLKRIETWIWVCIYAGMFGVALGFSVRRNDASLGWSFALAGAALVLVGILMLWLRSRVADASRPPR